MTLPERILLWEAELSFSSDLENFYYLYVHRRHEKGELLREKEWQMTVARDFQ